MTPSRFFTTTILSLSLTLAVLWHLTPVSIPEAQAAPLDRPMQDTLNVACTGGIGDTVDLIDKINQANLNGVDDTLILGTGCVYTLTSAYNADPDGYGPTGLPAIDTPITIDGNGATIKGITATFRIFYVTNTGDLTLDSLTLSDGLAQGKNGGRGNGGGGGSAGMGGAVFNRGQLTIQNSTLTGHQAIGGGGASTNTSFFGGGGGGGLGSVGSNASSSNFNGGDGGGVNGGNKGGGAGGEGGGGGGGTGSGTELGGKGGFGGGGGGGSDTQSVCAASSCFNHGGDGGFGGGGGGSGSTNGQFTPGDGGFGADNGNDNGNGGDGAGLGGAIFNYSGNVTLVNSTFYNNTARQEDSANGYGGGLFNYNGAVTVTNVTFADNTAVGGGIYNYGASASLAMSNALLANTANSKDDCTNNNGAVSGSNNLIESNNGCGTPAVTTDPNLDSLADNGGDTQTMALPDGSSAIDQIASGSNGCGTTVSTDQRGLARPQNGACDIGAYEFLEAAMEIEGNGQAIANGDTTPTTDNDTDFGGTDRFNAITHIFTIYNNGGENLILSGSPAVSLADGTHFSVTQPAITTIRFSEGITFSLTFTPQSPGAFTDTVTIDNNDSDENPYTFVISGTGYCSDVFYVNQAATGNNNGSSWVDAYTDLQDGLALAEVCTPVEVWVATGIYTPGLSRSDTFTLTSGIALYGGFAATETLRTERDWTANPTILSGDIDSNDTTDSNGVVTTTVHINGSNSYQVVYADGTGGTVITETTVLDGFTITAGQATAIIENRGGGFFCAGSGSGSECSPSLSNIIFSGNFAGSGGGMYNDGSSAGTSSPSLSNVTFFGNSATAGGGAIANIAISGGSTIPSLTNVAFIGNSGDDGGAIFNWAYQGGSVSSPSLTNVTFSGNSADRGGAIYNRGSTGGSVSSPSLTNVTLSGNSANRGGALYSASASSGVSSPNLSNVILWGNTATLSGTQLYHDEATSVLNYTLIQSDTSAIYNENGGSVTDGLGNLTSDPLFADGPGADGLTGTLDDDLRLLPGSPAIDSGTNSGAPTEDLNGVGRPVNGTVDMGAYESQGFSLTISGGNNQSTLFDTAFAEPLQVIVSSAAGEPVGPGGVISFTAPGSGASLATASFTANTNSSGAALATVTANIFGGSYQVSATAAGVSSPVTFSLTNTGFVILGLEKKVELANSPATPSESITYTIVISNSGNEDASAVTVQDTLPPGVSGADLSWTGLVTAGESLTFTIQATVTQEAGYGATVTNTASFSHSSGSGSDSASFSTVIPNLALTKTVKLSNTPAHIGDAITYTLVLANNGTAEATNISLQDTLPVGVSGTNLSKTVTVPAGTALTFTLKATVTSAAGYGNIILNTATYSHTSGSGSDTAGFTTIADTVPPSFSASPLITPTNGIELTGLRPTFDWDDATDSQSGVVSYTLLITSSNDSLSLQETWTATTTASNFTPSADLATGSYTWTVRAHDAAGNVSAYVSPAASFEITAGSSGIPIYLPIVSRK